MNRKEQLPHSVVTVRTAAEEDIPAIAAIEAQCFSEPWSAEGFRSALLEKDTAVVFAAETAPGRIAGYLVLYHAVDEGEIMTVASDPAARRCGVGQALLGSAMDFARQNGIRKIFLEVRISNEPAISLYEKNGFVRVGVRKRFYSLPEEDAYSYALELE